MLQQKSDLAIARGVYTLHRVLKELSTKRLSRDRLALAAVSVQLFPVVSAVWLERSAQLMQALGPWSAGGSAAGLPMPGTKGARVLQFFSFP